MSLYPDDYASGHNAVNIIDKFGSLKNQSRHSIVDESITMTAAMISDEEDDNSIRVNRTLNTVDSLTEDINSIANYMKQISSNHSAILSSFQNDDARKQNGEIQNKIKEISHRVTDELKVMKRMLERDEIGPDRDTANFRIRKAQYATLSRKFRDVMLEFNKIQEDYRDKNKEKIQRQLKIAGKDISEDKLEEILESENPQTFTDNILDVNILQKRKIVSEMETRHMEILSLEDSIRVHTQSVTVDLSIRIPLI
jgi:t-SNARE complex subunit (syntaxin)